MSEKFYDKLGLLLSEALSSKLSPMESGQLVHDEGIQVSYDLIVAHIERGDFRQALLSLQDLLFEDRSIIRLYLIAASLYFETKDYLNSYIYLSEWKRWSDSDLVLPELPAELASQSDLSTYLASIAWSKACKSEKPLKILVISNLLPPQELGGYGKTVFEFSKMFIQRGHDLKVLTADVPYLLKKDQEVDTEVESKVSRELRVYGEWENGKACDCEDMDYVFQVCLHNHKSVVRAVERYKPDVCMVGNLDFLGNSFLHTILELKIPVLHRLGNSNPGYSVDMTPESPLYCIAGCSAWVNENVRQEGYPIENYAVVYPGAKLHHYYLYHPISTETLRICYAGLIVSFKGVHILLEALRLLAIQGIDFTCELAGDLEQSDLMEVIEEYQSCRILKEKLKFIGYQDRFGLKQMYARSNVLVFPSIFEEPFGKSQIEAMAAGLCIVSSGTGGSKEIIQDRQNGLLYEKNNAEQLTDKLRFLTENKEVWKCCAAQGQKDAFAFTTINSVLEIENNFHEMLMDSSEAKAREVKRDNDYE